MTTSTELEKLWERSRGLEDVIEMVVTYLSDETPIYEDGEPIEEACQARNRVIGAARLLRDALDDYGIMISNMGDELKAGESERRQRQATTTEAHAN